MWPVLDKDFTLIASPSSKGRNNNLRKAKGTARIETKVQPPNGSGLICVRMWVEEKAW